MVGGLFIPFKKFSMLSAPQYTPGWREAKQTNRAMRAKQV